MISANELRDFMPTHRFINGNDVTLDTIQTELKVAAQNIQIPLSFYNDQVKSGGVFSKVIEDSLVLYHPEHRNDYFKLCIRVQRQGTMAFVVVNDFGMSKNRIKASSAKGAIDGGELGAFGSSIANRIFGPNKQKMEEEENYYSCLEDVINEVICYSEE